MRSLRREIKFRAWNNDQMFHDVVMDGNRVHCEITSDECPCKSNGWEGAILMQYTGLLDKNGKEIWEGDIVEWNDGDISKQVYWDNKEASFYVGCEGEGYLLHELDCEVIGNIHENPELLTTN